MKFGLIVEGHAEVTAVPVLLRKIAIDMRFNGEIIIPNAFRLSRGKIVKEMEIKRTAAYMANKSGPDGTILVIFDADDDCPATLGPQILSWIQQAMPGRRAIVILANREYESWFIASAGSYNGERGVRDEISIPANHETIRDAKGWVSENMVSGYSQTRDQEKLSATIDTNAARTNSSFDKLMRDLAQVFV